MSQHPEIFGEMKVVCVNMEVIQFINCIIKWKWLNEVWHMKRCINELIIIYSIL